MSWPAYAQREAAENRRTHGDSTTRLYGVWHQMRGRCSNPANESYSRYGAKGIRVSPEWQDDYPSFKAWAYANGYVEGLTLDRVDPDRGYGPSNCRWLSRSENSRYATTYRVDQVEALKVRVRELEKQIKCLDVIEASQEDRILKKTMDHHAPSDVEAEQIVRDVEESMGHLIDGSRCGGAG